MKKFFLLAATVFTISQTASAQIYFGPEVGATMTQLSFDNSAAGFGTSSKSGLGMKIGGLLELPMSNHWYIQPGMFFDMRNSSASQTYLNNKSNDYNWHINSLEVPLNFVLKTGQDGHHRVWFAAGGYISYGLGGRLENTDYNAVPYSYYAGETVTLSNGIDYGASNPSSLSRLDYGAQANIGFEFPMGLFIRANYSQGFANRAPYSNLDYKTMGMSLSVGYLFGGNRNFIIP
jgi:hypothetical protein